MDLHIANPLLGSRTLIAVAVAMLCTLISSSVLAQKRHWQKPGTRGVWVELDRFEIERHGNQLWADYAFSPESWGAMRRLNIRPQLRATITNDDRGAPFRRTAQQGMPGRSGRVVLPAPGGKYRAEVSIEGHNRRIGILGIRSGALQVKAVVFESTRDEIPVAAPCGGPGQRKCLPHPTAQQIHTQQPVYGQHGGHAPEPQVMPPTSTPSDTIKACGEALFSSSQQSACVKVAASKPHGANVVRACGEALFGQSDRLTCIERGVQTRYNPATLIKACGEALFGQRDRLKCIDIAANARRNPAATISTCGESMHSQSARLECIKNAT